MQDKMALAKAAKLSRPEIFDEHKAAKNSDVCAVSRRERVLGAPSLQAYLEQKPYIMAPMAGVSDKAYRLMAAAGGADTAYSEMVSVAGIHYGGEKTWDLVLPDQREGAYVVQLFGSKPEQFSEAAKKVIERLGDSLAWIDVNMACPVPKVTKKGEGSALLDDPKQASAIARALLKVLEPEGIDLTCKIRKSRVAGSELAPDFARVLEDAGVSAVAVHGRTATQLYRGEADWSTIERVVSAVTIPVIGSGDVLSAKAAHDMRAQTGASAVMLARGTYGNPWIFAAAKDLDAGKDPFEIGVVERLSAFELHLMLLYETGAHLARARSLAGWYFKGMPHAAKWRNRSMSCETLEDYLECLAELKGYLEAGV